MKKDHAKTVNSDAKMQADQSIHVFNCVVEKEKYLIVKQIDQFIHRNGLKNMQDFHNSLKFKIYKCNICHEAWPLVAKCKEEFTYVCCRCVRDKNATKKFSIDNNMIPSQVPKQLHGLAQLEEMFIAHVFPVISVYTKPGGANIPLNEFKIKFLATMAFTDAKGDPTNATLAEKIKHLIKFANFFSPCLVQST